MSLPIDCSLPPPPLPPTLAPRSAWRAAYTSFVHGSFRWQRGLVEHNLHRTISRPPSRPFTSVAESSAGWGGRRRFCIETPSQILTGVSGPAWGSTNNNITIAVYLHRCVKRWLSLGDFWRGVALLEYLTSWETPKSNLQQQA